MFLFRFFKFFDFVYLLHIGFFFFLFVFGCFTLAALKTSALCYMIKSASKFITLSLVTKIKLPFHELGTQLIRTRIISFSIPIEIQTYPTFKFFSINRVLTMQSTIFVIGAPSF